MVETILERILVSAGKVLHPSSVFKHFLEFISFGVFNYKSGSGVKDPCEPGLVDIFGSLSIQDKEDIVASAQHALRMVALRQCHKVLSMKAPSREELFIQLPKIEYPRNSYLSHQQPPPPPFLGFPAPNGGQRFAPRMNCSNGSYQFKKPKYC